MRLFHVSAKDEWLTLWMVYVGCGRGKSTYCEIVKFLELDMGRWIEKSVYERVDGGSEQRR